MEAAAVQYAGFWRRVGASLIDTLLLLLVLMPLAYLLFGADYFQAAGPQTAADGAFLLENVLPAVLVIFFWVRYGGTPGKQLLGCRVVDAATGRPPTVGRAVLRYLGYIVSTLPLLLGFLWVAWDRRKQGFHDKIAGTLVVRVEPGYGTDDESRKSLQRLVKEAS
jgi:uncharacterized RDD family membrane protein YckC